MRDTPPGRLDLTKLYTLGAGTGWLRSANWTLDLPAGGEICYIFSTNVWLLLRHILTVFTHVPNILCKD